MTKDRFFGPARSPFNLSYAMKWKNTSGETIPAYACIKLESYDAATDTFNAVKPDGEGKLHFANGPIPVAADAYGGSQLWNQSRIGKTSSLTFGAEVGPVANSWNFGEGGSGFLVFSTPTDGVAAILHVGGGGTHEIWFTIISVACDPYTLVKTLTVSVTWHTGGCTADIPDADQYTGYVDVEDICSILDYYTAESLVGMIGRATYMWPRQGTCVAKWLLDTICGMPECA